jgi:hypothetical protein
MDVSSSARAAIDQWHDAVNDKDLTAARRAAADPIVVSGPRGAGRITGDQFADWIVQSGIEMRPLTYHPVTERLIVVEQDVRWPASTDWTCLATVFRTSGDRVSAALRFPTLSAALDFAQMYVELVATEAP